MNEETNTIHEEYTTSTMKEVVYMSTGELNDELDSFLATATIADKKWLWNYFKGHDSWPIIVDELEQEVKYGVPRVG